MSMSYFDACDFAAEERRVEERMTAAYEELFDDPARFVEAIGDWTSGQECGALRQLIAALTSHYGCTYAPDKVVERHHAAQVVLERLAAEIVDKRRNHGEFRS